MDDDAILEMVPLSTPSRDDEVDTVVLEKNDAEPDSSITEQPTQPASALADQSPAAPIPDDQVPTQVLPKTKAAQEQTSSKTHDEQSPAQTLEHETSHEQPTANNQQDAPQNPTQTTEPETIIKDELSSVSPNIQVGTRFIASASQPIASASQPIASASQPIASASQPIASASQPIASASQPIASASQPIASSDAIASAEVSPAFPKQLPETPLPETPAKKPVKRKWWRIALLIFATFLVLGGSALGAGYYYYYNTVQKPLQKFVRPVSRSTMEPTIANSTPTYDVIKGRSWNILLLGSDNDRKYTFPAVLTQVMMIVRIDTVNNTVNMVSIPRDSWVNVPGMGMHKVDQAFFLGALEHNSFEDGLRVARMTIEKDYGIPIDRYAWVGLEGFASVIDILGGIDINVEHPIVDDAYPDDTGVDHQDPNALKRLYIAPGIQHLNGLEALEYVRSRHADQVGDIGRTYRQQQVLAALKLKLNLSTVIEKLPALISALTGHIYTDLNEEELIAFANYGRNLNDKNIQRLTLGPGEGKQNYGELATIYDPSVGSDQSVVIPYCDTIQPTINRIFELKDKQSCNVNG